MSFVKGSCQVSLYRVSSEGLPAEAEELAELLASREDLQHVELRPTQEVGRGWVSAADMTQPLAADALAPCAGRFVFLDLRIDRKRVHPALLKARVALLAEAKRAELVAAGELEEGKQISKDELATIKQAAKDELLPAAPISMSTVPVVIDVAPVGPWAQEGTFTVYVGSRSPSKCDDAIIHLMSALDTTPESVEFPSSMSELALYTLWKSAFDPQVGDWTMSSGSTTKLFLENGAVSKVVLSGSDIAQSSRLAECLHDDAVVVAADFDAEDADSQIRKISVAVEGLAVGKLPGGRDTAGTRFDRMTFLERILDRIVWTLAVAASEADTEEIKAAFAAVEHEGAAA